MVDYGLRFDDLGVDEDAEFSAMIPEIIASSKLDIELRLLTIPEPSRSRMRDLINIYFSRGLWHPQRINLGIAYDLGGRDTSALRRLNTMAGYGLLNSLVLDDIVDNKGVGKNSPLRDVYIAHMFFNLYSDAWVSACSSDVSKMQGRFVDLEMETYNALFEEESEHVDRPRSYSSPALVWKKCAPMKAIALAVLYNANRLELRDSVFSILDRSSYAACILDDLLDWEEDFDRCRFTYPLQQALDRGRIVYVAEQHEEIKMRVLRELCYSPLYGSLLSEACAIFGATSREASMFSPHLSKWLSAYRNAALDSWQHHVSFLADAAAHL